MGAQGKVYLLWLVTYLMLQDLYFESFIKVTCIYYFCSRSIPLLINSNDSWWEFWLSWQAIPSLRSCNFLSFAICLLLVVNTLYHCYFLSLTFYWCCLLQTSLKVWTVGQEQIVVRQFYNHTSFLSNPFFCFEVKLRMSTWNVSNIYCTGKLWSV